jgi:hypothetical protein
LRLLTLKRELRTVSALRNGPKEYLRAAAPYRRAALLMLTKPGAELVKMVSENRDYALALAELSKPLADHVQHLQGLVYLLKSVEARTMVLLASRPDMMSILEEQQLSESGQTGHA